MESSEIGFFDDMDHTLYGAKGRLMVIDVILRERRELADDLGADETNGLYCVLNDAIEGVTEAIERLDGERKRRKEAA